MNIDLVYVCFCECVCICVCVCGNPVQNLKLKEKKTIILRGCEI